MELPSAVFVLQALFVGSLVMSAKALIWKIEKRWIACWLRICVVVLDGRPSEKQQQKFQLNTLNEISSWRAVKQALKLGHTKSSAPK
jgi:hypothetical protein